MTARRFVKTDLDYWHKTTCDTLWNELGPVGPIAWLSLIAEAKRSRIPGVVIAASEPDFWQQLALYDRDVPFNMDTFLSLTGRLKQTSRTRVGRLLHVTLTHYEEWQRDWRQEGDADRQKRRRSRVSTRDTDRDAPRDAERDRELGSRSTPQTPLPETPDGLRCCAPDGACISLTFKNQRQLRDHLETVHWLTDQQITDALTGGTDDEDWEALAAASRKEGA